MADRHMPVQFLRTRENDLFRRGKVSSRLGHAVFIQDTERILSGYQRLHAPLRYADPAYGSFLLLLHKGAEDRIERGVLAEGRTFRAQGGKEKDPSAVLADQRSFLVQQNHQVPANLQGMQGIIHRKLQEKFIHSALIG